jgi:hypothetical protein
LEEYKPYCLDISWIFFDTMASTPPPPARLHTPPAPLHGGRIDDWEPFSPRRSSRVAAQRNGNSNRQDITSYLTKAAPSQASSSSRNPRVARRVTTPSPGELSSSDVSPNLALTPRTQRRNKQIRPPVFDNFTPATKPKTRSALEDFSSPGETASLRVDETNPFNLPEHAMLPTPSKTPRKRDVHSKAALSSTARVLFHDRNATVEDAMPSAKKARKSKTTHFSLGSFEEAVDEQGTSQEKIKIYTDPTDQVPTVDDAEENPFYSKTRKGKGKGRAPKAQDKKSQVDAATAEMMDNVQHDQGVMYQW